VLIAGEQRDSAEEIADRRYVTGGRSTKPTPRRSRAKWSSPVPCDEERNDPPVERVRMLVDAWTG
jgi:hypothetical protein